jgi:branched-chain amino acid aminotransferase
MERFERSAMMILMDLGYSVDDTVEAVKDTIRANKLPACYIRPIAFRGYGVMGLDPMPAPVQVSIACWPWETYMGEDALVHGVDVGVSSWRQRSANANPPAIKATANYLNSSLARIEANRHGYNEAVMLNEQGKVCEGTGENLFIVRDGVISTPPVADGILEGITRDSIMIIADNLGYPVIEESLVRTDLYSADEMFMTGSAAEVVPVRSVDGRVIGDAGPVTLELQKTFFRVVHGEEPGYEEWLEHV